MTSTTGKLNFYSARLETMNVVVRCEKKIVALENLAYELASEIYAQIAGTAAKKQIAVAFKGKAYWYGIAR